MDNFTRSKTINHTEDDIVALKTLDQRITQFNLRMKFNETFKQPTPDDFLTTFQELYDEGVSKGKTFVRNSDTDYFYLEDYTELANDIKLHSVLFDPNAPSRVPIDQPLIALVGGGPRDLVALKDKLLFLKTGSTLKGEFFLIKGKNFGGKKSWAYLLQHSNPKSVRDHSKTLFNGMTEPVNDKKIFRKLRNINGLSDKKYNSLSFFKLKHSFNDVEKVIMAKLNEIYSTKTFTRRTRDSVQDRLRKISSQFTTGGITNESFKIYHVELQEVIKRLMSINNNDILNVETGELAKQYMEIVLDDAKPLTISRRDGNTVNLFKHVNSLRYSLNDKRFIQVANKYEKTKSGHFKCWYEGCPEAWMNAVTRYILQDPEFRKALNLEYQENICSIHTGQGRVTKGSEPSGFPDITTIDMNGKAIDIIQVKQLGYNKPNEAIDLFRDITKTIGWYNSQGINSALNSFVFESSDLSRLNKLEKFGYNNVIIIGKWNNMKEVTRFGEAVEAVRIYKNVVNTTRISSMHLSNPIKNATDISKKLKRSWILIKGVKLGGLTPISKDLLAKIIDEANLYSDPIEYYKAMIQFIGKHIVKNN